MKKTLFILFFLLTTAGSAQEDQYQLGGYVKYLYSNSSNPPFGTLNDHLLHSRFNGKYFLSTAITAAVEMRNRIVAGGSVERIPGFVSTLRPDYDLGNGDIIWWSSRTTAAHSEFDRAWIDATAGQWQFTAGRQRIAWGTALVWNPTDLFNPLSVLDFDYEERPAVDAVRTQYFLSEVSKIELAVKPGKTSSRRIIAGKILINQWEYDFHLLAGFKGSEPFAGGAWAGDIAGAGFRGEIVVKKSGNETVLLAPQLRNTWGATVALSADYTFTNNAYLHTEALYNSRGVTSNAALFLPVSLSLGLHSPARWSLFQEVSFDLHPLVRASAFALYNPNDESSAVVPSATWSVVENFDLSFFGLLFSGDPGTEYGGYGTAYFLRGKFSF